MSLGRLGSWEFHGKSNHFYGGLGYSRFSQGAIETVAQLRQSQDIGRKAQRAESRNADITSAVLRSSAGVANAKRFVPGKFLAQHPYLKQFMR